MEGEFSLTSNSLRLQEILLNNLNPRVRNSIRKDSWDILHNNPILQTWEPHEKQWIGAQSRRQRR